MSKRYSSALSSPRIIGKEDGSETMSSSIFSIETMGLSVQTWIRWLRNFGRRIEELRETAGRRAGGQVAHVPIPANQRTWGTLISLICQSGNVGHSQEKSKCPRQSANRQ